MFHEVPSCLRPHSNQEKSKWITESLGFNCICILWLHVSKVNKTGKYVSLENGEISERKENWRIFTRPGLAEEDINIISKFRIY